MPVSTDELIKYFKKDRFAEYVGIELIEGGDGYAKARLVIDERHLNGLDMVHGGVLFSLADLAFAAAVNSRGRVAVAINISISYVNAARGKTLYAEAREVAANEKLASYTVHVTEETGEIIAVFQGMTYRKKQRPDLQKNI